MVTSHIRHSTDVRAEWSFFSALKYMISPVLSTKKYITDPTFVKGPTFLTSRYMPTFFFFFFLIRAFSRLLVFLVFNEFTAIFV